MRGESRGHRDASLKSFLLLPKKGVKLFKSWFRGNLLQPSSSCLLWGLRLLRIGEGLTKTWSDEDEGNIEMESIGDDDHESVDGRDNNLDYDSDGSTEDLEDEPLD